MDERELDDRLELAIRIAREAGNLTLTYFQRTDVQVELKADESPVTVADREAEQLLRRRIAAAFPDDSILGEEFAAQDGSSPYRWILDPIDGTKSFIRGVPLYGTMIGVECEGESLIGVVFIPPLDEMVYAGRGRGCWYDRNSAGPQQARVSEIGQLAEGLFCTTDDVTYARLNRDGVLARLKEQAKLSRTWGDCYGYLLVATGRAEAMIDPIMNVWDAAALAPILEEAGGPFTDWQGRPTIHAGEGIGTNSLVLDEVLAVTRGN